MGTYTIKQICMDTGLSRHMVLCHLNGKVLSSNKKNGAYEIDNEEYEKWCKNIPDLNDVVSNSEFCGYNENQYMDNHNELFEERNVEENVFDIDSMLNGIVCDKKSKLTFADFFSGAGGISCGFAAAGFRPIAFVDNFPEASATYRNYFENIQGLKFRQEKDCLDITDKQTKKRVIEILLQEHPYVICGGFPCQGFSLSGTGIATDPRNTLYQDMLEIVKEVGPEYIVMENVLGILSMLKGNVVRKIISDYERIGYMITWRVLDAADYGVPQHRKRVIFIGNRIGNNNHFPQKIKSEKNYVSVKQAIERYKDIKEDASINHIFSKHSDEMKKRLSNVEIGRTLYENYNDSWKKCNPDSPSCTIKENHGATNIHYSEPRVITAREMAALQSFPNDYFFTGPKTKQIKQIGNAVPPILAQAIAEAIKPEIKNIIEMK